MKQIHGHKAWWKYSLSWGDKNNAFHLPCDINKNGKAKTPGPSNGGPLKFFCRYESIRNQSYWKWVVFGNTLIHCPGNSLKSPETDVVHKILIFKASATISFRFQSVAMVSYFIWHHVTFSTIWAPLNVLPGVPHFTDISRDYFWLHLITTDCHSPRFPPTILQEITWTMIKLGLILTQSFPHWNPLTT